MSKFKMKSVLGNIALEELSEEITAEEQEQVEGQGADEKVEEEVIAVVTEDTEGAKAEGKGGAAAGDEAGSDGEAGAGDPEVGEGEEEVVGEGEQEAGEEPADKGTQEEEESAEAVAEVEGADDIPVGEDAEGGDAEDEIAEEVAEVENTSDKVEAAADDLDKMQEATESLQETLAIVEASVQRGGMDPIAAMLLRKDLRNACESLDVSATAIMLPALEEAETPSSRMGMAGDVIESIKRFIARIAKSIADGFKKFGEWLASIWTRLFDANKKIKARAEKLKEILKGAEMAEKVTSKSVIANVQPYVEDAKQVVTASKTTLTVTTGLCDADNYKHYLGAIEAVKKAIADGKSIDEAQKEVNGELEKLAKTIGDIAAKSTQDGGFSNVDKDVARSYVYLPGKRIVGVAVPTSTETLGFASVVNQAADKPLQNVKEVKALDDKQAQDVCDNVIATCDWFEKSYNNGKDGKALAEAIKKNTDVLRITNDAGIEKFGKEEGKSENFVKFIRWVNKFSTTVPSLPIYKVAKAAPAANAALLDFVAASIAKKAEPAAAAA